MNIFQKAALKGLIKSRARTIVTVIGVVLSAALLTGVTSFGISLLDYLAKGAAERYGSWHVGFYDVPAAFLQERKQDEHVLDVAAVSNLGYALLDDAAVPSGEMESGTELAGSAEPEKPYLFVSGYDAKAFAMLPVYLISGRLPENDSEVIISGGLSVNNGIDLQEGSVLTLELGTRTSGGELLGQCDRYEVGNETFTPRETRTFTVVGMCRRPQYERSSAPGYTLITKTDGSVAAESYTAFVELDNPRGIRDYTKATAGEYRSTQNDEVLRFLGLSEDKLFTTLMLAVGGVVIAIVMVGSIFLIHNAFQISLNERMHQFGILLSVGATARQLRGMVLFEGICIGLLGIPAGVLLGLGGIRGVIAFLAKSFQNIFYSNAIELVVSFPVVAVSAGIALVTILISAYIPAKKAAAVPVMDCLRQIGEIRVEAKAVKTSRFAERVYGLEGLLALKNFKRNKRRYRSIVLSLVLSVVLFVSTNAFVIDLQQASEAAVVFTTFDLGFAAKNMEDAELLSLYDRLKNVEGVTESGYQEVRRYTCTVPSEFASEDLRAEMGQADSYELKLDIQFLDEASWRELLTRAELSESDFSGTDAPMICIAKINNHVNRVLDPDEFVDMFTVPELETVIASEHDSGQSRALGLRFVSIVSYDSLNVDAVEETSYMMQAMAPWSVKGTFDALGTEPQSKGISFCSETPDRTEEDLRSILSELKPSVKYLLLNMNEMTRTNTNMIFIANVFSYVFIVMISLIAAANVFNTISTNIRLRRRELAMLRSVGMSERGFQRMMNFECVFYGMQALAAGVPLSMLSAYLIYWGMLVSGADAIKFVMPWAAIGVSIFSVLAIVFVTMLYAVSKIRRENIIDALRDDMA